MRGPERREGFFRARKLFRLTRATQNEEQISIVSILRQSRRLYRCEPLKAAVGSLTRPISLLPHVRGVEPLEVEPCDRPLIGNAYVSDMHRPPRATGSALSVPQFRLMRIARTPARSGLAHSRKCQTSTATPAKPGGLSLTLGIWVRNGCDGREAVIGHER